MGTSLRHYRSASNPLITNREIYADRHRCEHQDNHPCQRRQREDQLDRGNPWAWLNAARCTGVSQFGREAVLHTLDLDDAEPLGR